MFKIKVLLVLVCLFRAVSMAQTVKVDVLDSISGSIDHFSVDNMGNVYLTNNDVIVKLNAKHDTLFSASLKSMTPQFIQSTKNFRILLFDQDRSVIQFLDNTLTDLSGDMNLFELDVVRPILVCESFNGNAFWVLDAGTLRLLKVNDKFEVVSQIDNLSFLNASGVLPTKMLEYNDRLYILVPGEKLMVFDVFGSFLKAIPLKSHHFSIQKNTMMIYDGAFFNLWSLHDLYHQVSKILAVDSVVSYQYINHRLYVQGKTGIRIYQINVEKPANNK